MVQDSPGTQAACDWVSVTRLSVSTPPVVREPSTVDLVDVRRLERILVQALEEEALPQLPLCQCQPGRFARSR